MMMAIWMSLSSSTILDLFVCNYFLLVEENLKTRMSFQDPFAAYLPLSTAKDHAMDNLAMLDVK